MAVLPFGRPSVDLGRGRMQQTAIRETKLGRATYRGGPGPCCPSLACCGAVIALRGRLRRFVIASRGKAGFLCRLVISVGTPARGVTFNNFCGACSSGVRPCKPKRLRGVLRPCPAGDALSDRRDALSDGRLEEVSVEGGRHRQDPGSRPDCGRDAGKDREPPCVFVIIHALPRVAGRPADGPLVRGPSSSVGLRPVARRGAAPLGCCVSGHGDFQRCSGEIVRPSGIGRCARQKSGWLVRRRPPHACRRPFAPRPCLSLRDLRV